MYKIIMLSFFVFGVAFGVETLDSRALTFKQIESKIEKIEDDVIYISNNQIKVGESGMVIKKIGDSDIDILIAQLEIISIENGMAKAKWSDTEYMNQKYLPTPREVPSAGDKVLFRTFASKGLIIAPTQNNYDHISQTIKNIDFIHPDLFSAFLFNLGHPDPKIEHFKEFCQTNSVGIVFIEVSSGVAMLDCYTFKHIANLSIQTNQAATTQVPFFSRIKEITGGSIISKLRPVRSKNYYKYFNDLVQDAKPEL